VARIKVDLHDIYNNRKAISKVLQDTFVEAIDKKKVQRFLQMPHFKPLFHSIENDSKNFGRLFVYFKF